MAFELNPPSVHEVAAIVIAVLALAIATLSWRASVQNARAAIFEQRFQVYADAEKFLGFWLREARPDIDQLDLVIAAWSRSHFLFDKTVTAYLRELWVDAVKANEASDIVSGKYEGDHQAAVQVKFDLIKKHADYAKLRKIFQKQMKVS